MTVKSVFNRLLGRSYGNDVASSDVANASEEEVVRKIHQTQDLAKRVIKAAHAERAHAERIILLAEAAVQSLRKVEKQH